MADDKGNVGNVFDDSLLDGSDVEPAAATGTQQSATGNGKPATGNGKQETGSGTGPPQPSVVVDHLPGDADTVAFRVGNLGQQPDIQKLNERLLNATICDDVVAAEKALDDGAELECHDKYERTPLLCASSRGSKRVFDLLRARGADRTAKDRADRDSLTLARQNNNSEIIQALQEWEQADATSSGAQAAGPKGAPTQGPKPAAPARPSEPTEEQKLLEDIRSGDLTTALVILRRSSGRFDPGNLAGEYTSQSSGEALSPDRFKQIWNGYCKAGYNDGFILVALEALGVDNFSDPKKVRGLARFGESEAERIVLTLRKKLMETFNNDGIVVQQILPRFFEIVVAASRTKHFGMGTNDLIDKLVSNGVGRDGAFEGWTQDRMQSVLRKASENYDHYSFMHRRNVHRALGIAGALYAAGLAIFGVHTMLTMLSSRYSRNYSRNKAEQSASVAPVPKKPAAAQEAMTLSVKGDYFKFGNVTINGFPNGRCAIHKDKLMAVLREYYRVMNSSSVKEYTPPSTLLYDALGQGDSCGPKSYDTRQITEQTLEGMFRLVLGSSLTADVRSVAEQAGKAEAKKAAEAAAQQAPAAPQPAASQPVSGSQQPVSGSESPAPASQKPELAQPEPAQPVEQPAQPKPTKSSKSGTAGAGSGAGPEPPISFSSDAERDQFEKTREAIQRICGFHGQQADDATRRYVGCRRDKRAMCAPCGNR